MDEDMDVWEQMSWDLEVAQQKRHAKAGGSDEFWTNEEAYIFNRIVQWRKLSKTFDPLNSR